MIRLVLFVLLTGNAAVQLLGGAMMIADPEKLGRDTFGLAAGGAVTSLVPLLGGVTLSYALMSATAAVAVLQRRAWAPLLVLLLAAMLALVGLVMLLHGVRVGAVDVTKAAILSAAAVAMARRQARDQT